MIFLSASIPTKDRPFYGTTNDIAITGAVIAFARVCAEYNIEFYFGGHPAITPLILKVGEEFSEHFKTKVHIYQSEHFKKDTPKALSYYNDITWTEDAKERDEYLGILRNKMFENVTECAVFIGGMDGVINEFEILHEKQPKTKIIPIASAGGASREIYKRMNLSNKLLERNMAYLDVFRKVLDEYKSNQK